MDKSNDTPKQAQKAPNTVRLSQISSLFAPAPPAPTIEVDNDNTLASLYTPPVTRL